MTYNEVYIKVDDIKNVDKICDTLKEEGYQISSMVDYRKQMQQSEKKAENQSILEFAGWMRPE